MTKCRVKDMALFHAVPPCEGMVCTHGGSTGIVSLLVDCQEDMIAWLATRIIGKRVPLFRAVPECREALCDGIPEILHVNVTRLYG